MYCVGTCSVLCGIEPTCHELLHILCVTKRVGVDLLVECSTVHGRGIMINLGGGFACPAASLVHPKEPTSQRLIRKKEACEKKDLCKEPLGLGIEEDVALIIFRGYAGV